MRTIDQQVLISLLSGIVWITLILLMTSCSTPGSKYVCDQYIGKEKEECLEKYERQVRHREYMQDRLRGSKQFNPF